MVRYGMLIEVDRCIGCDLCLKACKDEYVGNSYLPYSEAQPQVSYGYGQNGTFGWPDTPSTLTPWVTRGHLWMNVFEQTSGKYPDVKTRYAPLPCVHCDDPPCEKSATNNAIYTVDNGIVIIDPEKSSNQNQIVESCPYGVIYWNNEKAIPQKCTFCAHLVEKGMQPRCVEACPLTVITFGDIEDPNSDISKKITSTGAKPFHPEYGTKPKVYYVGLPD
jgi:tetrathionate reductase subunit B